MSEIIPPDKIPLLGNKGIIEGESVAFGVFTSGVIVQYLERDICILIDWNDIILYGLAILKSGQNAAAIEEIESPTERE